MEHKLPFVLVSIRKSDLSGSDVHQICRINSNFLFSAKEPKLKRFFKTGADYLSMSTKNFPFAVKAIADYVPTNAGSELRLVTGQIYEVLADDGKGVWYQSCVGGVTGWFPANYTEIVETVSPGKEDLPKPPSTQKPLKDSRGKTKSKSSKSKKSKSSSKKTTKPPIPLKSYVEKNKKNLPCTLNIQGIQ